MSPSPRGLALALGAAGALGMSAVAACDQEEPGSDRDVAGNAEVRQLALPMLDLKLETASLDESVRRVEGVGDVRVTLAADVLFEFNSARLAGGARSRIEQAAQEIRAARPRVVTVDGHTDGKGSDAYNNRLSRARGEAVSRALAKALGPGRPRLLASGKGESRPVAANKKRDGSDNPKGRARNRRVEIRIPTR